MEMTRTHRNNLQGDNEKEIRRCWVSLAMLEKEANEQADEIPVPEELALLEVRRRLKKGVLELSTSF